MSDASILRRIQAEQRPWVAHNFGDRPAWMPLLGLVEEAGELAEADSDRDLAAISDALADIMIFSLDYCSAMGWDAGAIWESNAEIPNAGFIGMLKSLGKLAHAHLKAAQGIRVSEDHEAAGKKALGELFACLRVKDASLVERTSLTWQKVKKRDWKANPATAVPAPEPRTYEVSQTTLARAQAIMDIDEQGPAPEPTFVSAATRIPAAIEAVVPEPEKPPELPVEQEEDTVEDFLGTLDLV